MQIHELPDVTAIGSGGYFATDDGSQTTKIDYDALAKAIIEQYSASTLAGSAQSVKSALDGIKADSVLTRGASETVTASTNVNDYVTPGTYFFNSGTKAVNAPANSGYFRLVVTTPIGVLGGTNRVRYQEAVTSDGRVFTRRLNSSDGGQAWVAQDWAETPTRAEIDALSTNLAGLKIVGKTLAAGGSVTFTSTTVAHYVVFVCGAGGQRCAVVVRGASTTGYTIISDANGTSNITVSASGRDLTITSADTASAEAGAYAVVFSGTVS